LITSRGVDPLSWAGLWYLAAACRCPSRAPVFGPTESDGARREEMTRAG